MPHPLTPSPNGALKGTFEKSIWRGGRIREGAVPPLTGALPDPQNILMTR